MKRYTYSFLVVLLSLFVFSLNTYAFEELDQAPTVSGITFGNELISYGRTAHFGSLPNEEGYQVTPNNLSDLTITGTSYSDSGINPGLSKVSISGLTPLNLQNLTMNEYSHFNIGHYGGHGILNVNSISVNGFSSTTLSIFGVVGGELNLYGNFTGENAEFFLESFSFPSIANIEGDFLINEGSFEILASKAKFNKNVNFFGESHILGYYDNIEPNFLVLGFSDSKGIVKINENLTIGKNAYACIYGEVNFDVGENTNIVDNAILEIVSRDAFDFFSGLMLPLNPLVNIDGNLNIVNEAKVSVQMDRFDDEFDIQGVPTLNVKGDINLSAKSALYADGHNALDTQTANIIAGGSLLSDNSFVYILKNGFLTTMNGFLKNDSYLSVANEGLFSVTNELKLLFSTIDLNGTLEADSLILENSSYLNIFGQYTDIDKTNGMLEINSQSVMRGTGKAISDVANNAFVSLEAFSVPLTISGNYSQSSTGTIMTVVPVNNSVQILDVSGLSSISDGARVHLIFDENHADLSIGDKFDFLCTDLYKPGVFVVTYEGIAIRNGRLVVNISTGSRTTVYVELVSSTLSDIDYDLTYNQTQVFKDLLVAENGPNTSLNDIIATMAGYVSLLYGEAVTRTTLDDLSGVIHTATYQLRLSKPWEHIDAINDANSTKIKFAPILEIGNSFTDDNAKSFTSIYLGGALSITQRIVKSFDIGIFASLGATYLQQNFSNKDEAHGYDIQLGIFSNIKLGEIVLKSYMGYGVQSIKTERTLEIQSLSKYFLNSDYKTTNISADINVGWDHKKDGLGLIPTAGILYERIKRPQFVEDGNDTVSLIVSDKTHNILDLKFGLLYVTSIKNVDISLNVKYVVSLLDFRFDMDASFVGENRYFNVHGVNYGKNAFEVNFDVFIPLASLSNIVIKYIGEYRRYMAINTFSVEFNRKF